jgi:hypothetical protein
MVMTAIYIELSPQEILTRYKNTMQVTIQGDQGFPLREVNLAAECRLLVGGIAVETYLLSEKKFTAAELPGRSPLRLQWDIEVPRKGPITFTSDGFSLVYNAIITVMNEGGLVSKKELSFRVIPGRIAQEEIVEERKNMTP